MERYFFHVVDGEDFADLQGTLLPSLDAARKEALRFASDLLGNHEQFWREGEWQMRVTDSRDLTLFTLHFYATESPILKNGTTREDGLSEREAS